MPVTAFRRTDGPPRACAAGHRGGTAPAAKAGAAREVGARPRHAAVPLRVLRWLFPTQQASFTKDASE